MLHRSGFQDHWVLFSYPLYQYFQEYTPEFAQLAAAQTNRPGLAVRTEGATAAEHLAGELVSGNYFSTLGVGAAAGRLITPSDAQPSAPPVAVIRYRAWHAKNGTN